MSEVFSFLHGNERLKVVVAGKYKDETFAYRVVDEEGMPYATLSVCLEGNPPAEGCFWLKHWGENEPLARTLWSIRAISYTGRTCPSGYVIVQEAKFNLTTKE